LEEAHYSFPFCVALALTAGPDAFLPIGPGALASGRTLSLARRVTLAIDPAHDGAFPARTPATVVIRSARGDREMSVPTARGDPDLPFDAATLRHKHRLLAGRKDSGRDSGEDSGRDIGEEP
jgi:2-methylcitrate dehydratase PrpD